MDTYGTCGYMAAYALVAIARVVYTRREGMRNRLVWTCAVVVVLAMAYVFFANVWPVPAWPLNVIPYLFLATMIAAVAWYRYRVARRPEIVANIGNTETDVLEGVG
ncbi:MAG TPA: hypothetical protein VET27_16325 [Mycobacterium sp.]|nr:hypothetical protein [Mycobacterium sp.]